MPGMDTKQSNNDSAKYYERVSDNGYIDVTNIVKTFKSNELFYAGSMDLGQVSQILNNPYKGTEVSQEEIDHSSQIEQSTDNADTEHNRFVETDINFPSDAEYAEMFMPDMESDYDIKYTEPKYDIEESMRQQDEPMCIDPINKTI